ncbi:uncharacterized protein [Dysidea avara]|uniref:uncharacterized protein n=1 Tax=Dysidea avara TaxID=196820 RepID=UPI00332BDD6E
MIAPIILVILSAISASSSATGGYTTCMCNLNHPTCVQSQCTTDSVCQRVATVTTNRRIDYDHQLCFSNATAANSRCNSVFRRNENLIEVRYCCNQRYCNGNDTFMFEIIVAYLGDEVLNFLTPTTTTNMITTRGINTTPATTRTTTTNTVKATNTIGNTADRDNDDNNVSYVPLIIALTIVVFVLVQVVVVTAVLLVFCHRLK